MKNIFYLFLLLLTNYSIFSQIGVVNSNSVAKTQPSSTLSDNVGYTNIFNYNNVTTGNSGNTKFKGDSIQKWSNYAGGGITYTPQTTDGDIIRSNYILQKGVKYRIKLKCFLGNNAEIRVFATNHVDNNDFLDNYMYSNDEYVGYFTSPDNTNINVLIMLSGDASGSFKIALDVLVEKKPYIAYNNSNNIASFEKRLSEDTFSIFEGVKAGSYLVIDTVSKGNTVIGNNAFQNIIGSSNNVVIGDSAYNNITLNSLSLSEMATNNRRNTVIGSKAGTNSNLTESTILGFRAGYKGSSSYNVNIGNFSNETGSGGANVYLGYLSGRKCSSCSNNILTGTFSGQNAYNLNATIGVGTFVLSDAHNLTNLIAIGDNAFQNSSNTINSIGIGTAVLGNAVNTYGNIGIGLQSLMNLGSGVGFNIALGVFSGRTIQAGAGQNVIIGNTALSSTNSVSLGETVSIGSYSFKELTYGLGSIAVGTGAGMFSQSNGTYLLSSINSTFIGNYARASNTSSINELVIGASAIGLGNNTTVIGNTNTTFNRIYGNLSLGSNNNAGYTLDVAGTSKIASPTLTNVVDIQYNVQTLTSATTIVTSKFYFVNGSTSFLVTFPSASSSTGKLIYLKITGGAKTSSSYLDLTGTSSTTLTNNNVIRFISDGTNWQQY